MRRFTLLILTLVFFPGGCSRWSGSTNPTADEVTDFSGGDGRYTRTVFQSEARDWAYFSVYHRAHELILTMEEGELRAHAREVFRAGVDPGSVSVHGQSRGATGALSMAMNHPEEFASAVANAFVSDYALSDLKRDASRNKARVLESGIPIRMVVGTRHRYVIEENRTGTPEMHEHLQGLGIPHEYEVLLEGVTHGKHSIWNHRRPDGRNNGLYELQFHARAWARASPMGADLRPQ